MTYNKFAIAFSLKLKCLILSIYLYILSIYTLYILMGKIYLNGSGPLRIFNTLSSVHFKS